jgi:hypothetical protein
MIPEYLKTCLSILVIRNPDSYNDIASPKASLQFIGFFLNNNASLDLTFFSPDVMFSGSAAQEASFQLKQKEENHKQKDPGESADWLEFDIHLAGKLRKRISGIRPGYILDGWI